MRWSSVGMLMASFLVACGGGSEPPSTDPSVATTDAPEAMEEIFPAEPGVVESASARSLASATITDIAAANTITEIRAQGFPPSMIDRFSDLELLAYAYDLIERADSGAGYDLVDTEPERLTALGLGFEANEDVVFFLLEQSAGGLRNLALESGGAVTLDCDEQTYLSIAPAIDAVGAPTPQAAAEEAAVGSLGTASQVSQFGDRTLWVIRDGDRAIALVTVAPFKDGFRAGDIEVCSEYSEQL